MSIRLADVLLLHVLQQQRVHDATFKHPDYPSQLELSM